MGIGDRGVMGSRGGGRDFSVFLLPYSFFCFDVVVRRCCGCFGSSTRQMSFFQIMQAENSDLIVISVEPTFPIPTTRKTACAPAASLLCSGRGWSGSLCRPNGAPSWLRSTYSALAKGMAVGPYRLTMTRNVLGCEPSCALFSKSRRMGLLETNRREFRGRSRCRDKRHDFGSWRPALGG